MALRDVAQLGFDEVAIDDPELEQVLETRLAKKVVLDKVRKEYDEAHEAANAAIAQQELPDGGALRVGRFRVTRTAVAGRSVAFETKATSRVRILLVDEDGEEEAPHLDLDSVVDLANASRRAREVTP
jgi:hypothetical protein